MILIIIAFILFIIFLFIIWYNLIQRPEKRSKISEEKYYGGGMFGLGKYVWNSSPEPTEDEVEREINDAYEEYQRRMAEELEIVREAGSQISVDWDLESPTNLEGVPIPIQQTFDPKCFYGYDPFTLFKENIKEPKGDLNMEKEYDTINISDKYIIFKKSENVSKILLHSFTFNFKTRLSDVVGVHMNIKSDVIDANPDIDILIPINKSWYGIEEKPVSKASIYADLKKKATGGILNGHVIALYIRKRGGKSTHLFVIDSLRDDEIPELTEKIVEFFGKFFCSKPGCNNNPNNAKNCALQASTDINCISYTTRFIFNFLKISNDIDPREDEVEEFIRALCPGDTLRRRGIDVVLQKFMKLYYGPDPKVERTHEPTSFKGRPIEHLTEDNAIYYKRKAIEAKSKGRSAEE
jgi:hypothetical protein